MIKEFLLCPEPEGDSASQHLHFYARSKAPNVIAWGGRYEGSCFDSEKYRTAAKLEHSPHRRGALRRGGSGESFAKGEHCCDSNFLTHQRSAEKVPGRDDGCLYGEVDGISAGEGCYLRYICDASGELLFSSTSARGCADKMVSYAAKVWGCTFT